MGNLTKTATRQFAGLVLAPVEPRKQAELCDLLARVRDETVKTMQGEPPEAPLVPFERLKTVHYARLVLVDPYESVAATSEGKGAKTRPMLAFSTNYDGPEGEDDCSESRAWQRHVDELLAEAGDGLERIFEHCEEYRRGSLKAYFDKHRVKPSTFYVGSQGRSRDQIRAEAALRQRVDAILDAGDFTNKTPRAVREAVREKLKRDYPTLPEFPPQPDLSANVNKTLAKWGIATFVLLVTGVFFICKQLAVFGVTSLGVPWLDDLHFAHIVGLASLGVGLIAASSELALVPKLTGGVKTTLAKWVSLFAVLLAATAFVLCKVFDVQPFVSGVGFVSLVGIVVGIVASIGFVALLAVRHFRHLELTDPQFQPQYSAATHQQFEVASATENEFLQNQLTHLVPIKPGFLRWLLIRAVFWALQLLATNVYNKGKLGGIPSIHFARWTLIPNRGVLFFSNFDSSWQSYLGDFIDQASSGLTAVWSNTVGYPRTTWLLEAGSRDAGRFLAWTRYHQVPTQVWYAAYPGLSISNVNDNTEIRRGLADPQAVDATEWLSRLRGLDRVAADQLYSDEQTRAPALRLEHIQGLILKGYGHKPFARFLLFKVETTSPDLLLWLSKLELTSAKTASRFVATPDPLLNVAFSYRGLRALGLEAKLCDQFSTPFVQGSDHPYRALVNGDVGESAPEHWEWGTRDKAVDVVLLVYASSAKAADDFANQYREDAEKVGLRLLGQPLEGGTLTDRKEHFGFRDGISQPIVAGSGYAELDDHTIPPGELLLGHVDGYGNITHSPTSSSGFNFGMSGSYLVFRQLEQDVEAFWRYAAKQGDPARAVTVASKMVGRWPSGATLVRHPNSDPEDNRFIDENNFDYLSNDHENDRYGARCPFGAHIRRSNPRDWELGEDREESRRLSNLHRVMRRGRPYGPPLVESMAPLELIERAKSAGAAATESSATKEARGLQFLCFNANLERQFEFVQQQWCANPKFGGANSEPDPLFGLPTPASQLGLDAPSFTIQTDVAGGLAARCTGMQRFVRVMGSSYLFMPSLPAVRLLGSGLRPDPTDGTLEAIPPDEQLHIDGLIETLREKMKRDYVGRRTLRDAHPKMHGCVKARFIIEPNLKKELAVGLFGGAHSYDAWVRFSNQDGTVSPDIKPDIRGAAIKLMKVTGDKLLDGEEDSPTHDFILISGEKFVTKDVAEFDGLIKALVGGKLKLLRFLASHRRVAWNLWRSLQKHTSPLAVEYFSVAPYLLGSHAVKYRLRPTSPNLPSSIPDSPSDDYLREALVEHLKKGPATFDFMVQLQTDNKAMPIEDPGVAWSERDAPLHKVATLEIPQQSFDSRKQRDFGDNLSFNPWRCLPEHRPLGGISRARRQVYRALSQFRHERNGERQEEPVSWDI